MSPAAAAPPALPDINAETNPFELVEHLLDQAAYFNFRSVPRPGSGAAVEGMGGARGIEIAEDLRRFVITMGLPTEQCGLQARNSVGEIVASFKHRWLFAPDDFVAHPGEKP